MKRRATAFLLVVVLLLPTLTLAQKNVYGGTGNVRFKLNRAGSFALYDKDFLTHLDRASLIVALDSAHVFDYQEDANYLTASPILSIVGPADTVATALFDNSWVTPAPLPDVRVLANVYAWQNDSLVLAEYSITNYSAGPYDLQVGLGCVPYLSETWGGETVAYDTVSKMAYFYREGEMPYIGIKLLSQDPVSFHALDWDVYSPTDPSSDAATDSTRWRMTALPGFDAPIVGGVNGSFFNLNFGALTLGPNELAYCAVAYLKSTSLAGLRALGDTADVRYANYIGMSPTKYADGGTGVVQFSLNRAGSLDLYSEDGTNQLDRASLVVGLDSAHVFDYEEDANYIMMSAALSTGGLADSVGTVLFDNSWQDPPVPPNVRVLGILRAWNGDPFVLVDYTMTNTSASPYHLAVGMGVVPAPSDMYGGETVAYDATKKMAYYYRESEAPYVGVKVMGQDPSSFHVLDWDTYSSDPEADVATDSTRWLMTSQPGFDAPLVAGVNGSFFNLNFGTADIDPASSVTYTMAYLYSTSLSGLQAAADAAVARFNGTNAVRPTSSNVPERTSLEQNYPNPFNPSSTIEFAIAKESLVSLKVYNMLGQEVGTIVNSRLAPGHYTFRFDGSTLASGVYFYRLAAGSFVQTKHMILLK